MVQGPAGPYVIVDANGDIIGSTGLDVERRIAPRPVTCWLGKPGASATPRRSRARWPSMRSGWASGGYMHCAIPTIGHRCVCSRRPGSPSRVCSDVTPCFPTSTLRLRRTSSAGRDLDQPDRATSYTVQGTKVSRRQPAMSPDTAVRPDALRTPPGTDAMTCSRMPSSRTRRNRATIGRMDAIGYEHIRQLSGRYNLGIHLGSAESWAATFTPDGVIPLYRHACGQSARWPPARPSGD